MGHQKHQKAQVSSQREEPFKQMWLMGSVQTLLLEMQNISCTWDPESALAPLQGAECAKCRDFKMSFPQGSLANFPCDRNRKRLRFSSSLFFFFSLNYSRIKTSPLQFVWRRGRLRQKIAAICDCDFGALRYGAPRIRSLWEPGFGAYQGLAQKIKVPFLRLFLLLSAVLRVRGRKQDLRQTPVRAKVRLKRFPNEAFRHVIFE